MSCVFSLVRNAHLPEFLDLAALEAAAQAFGPSIDEISQPLLPEERPTDYIGAAFRA